MRAVVLACLVMSAPAWAQPGMTPPQLEPARIKSPSVALGLSAGTTLAGFVMLLVTNELVSPDDNGRQLRGEYRAPLYLTSSLLLLAGPTTGHIYAGKMWNPGLGIRLASAGLLVIGVSGFVGNIDHHDGGGSRDAASVFAGIAIAGGIGYVGGTVYEVAIAPSAARRFNARHAAPTLTVAPLIAREPGIAVVGQF